MLMDNISDAMVSMKNAENAGKDDCTIKSVSKLLGNVLKVMQKEGYVGEFEYVDDGKSGLYKVKLVGKINKCGAIKPRYAVKRDAYEKYEKRFLPARNIGILIVSTPHGVMTQNEAIKQKSGGRLLAFVY